MTTERKNSPAAVWEIRQSNLAWHWELHDHKGNKVGQSMAPFTSERLCLENARLHGMAIPPDREEERAPPPIDEAAIRADIKLLKAIHAERQRISSAGFSEKRSFPFDHESGKQAVRQKAYYVYFVSSRRGNALIAKMDADLPGLLVERRNKAASDGSPGPAAETIVWFETHPTLEDATARQRAIQKWPRQRKIGFIEALNPQWADLSTSILAP